MAREQMKQVKRQIRKNPRTIEEKMKSRDVFTYSRKYGTLRCKAKGLEIKEAHFGAKHPGEKVRSFKVPFTLEQAEEICYAFNHGFYCR
jgi:cytidylate kinase